MRISDLSRAADAPVPTIKYYIREGLLPAGERTSPNQASYGDEQLRLLRLIRVLVEVGGLSIAGVKEILAAADDRRSGVAGLVRAAQHAMVASLPREDEAWHHARTDVDAFLADLGWRIAPDSPARNALADVLFGLRTLGGEPTAAECFAEHADLATRLAAVEIARLPGTDAVRDDMAVALARMVVFESAFRALRLLAGEDAATRGDDLRPAPDGRPG
jgi:DNA-binding transcriptional MerR regulator